MLLHQWDSYCQTLFYVDIIESFYLERTLEGHLVQLTFSHVRENTVETSLKHS